MNGWVIVIIVGVLAYFLLLNPAQKGQVNQTMSAVKDFGQDKFGQKENPAVDTNDYGKPNCYTNSDCRQFQNSVCNLTSGHCILGGQNGG